MAFNTLAVVVLYWAFAALFIEWRMEVEQLKLEEAERTPYTMERRLITYCTAPIVLPLGMVFGLIRTIRGYRPK